MPVDDLLSPDLRVRDGGVVKVTEVAHANICVVASAEGQQCQGWIVDGSRAAWQAMPALRVRGTVGQRQEVNRLPGVADGWGRPVVGKEPRGASPISLQLNRVQGILEVTL